MACPVWCEIVCAKCAVTATGRYTYNAIPHAALVKDAKREGFRIIDGEPYCPRCIKNGEPK